MKTKKNTTQDSFLDDLFVWQTNRRDWLRAALIGGSITQLAFLQACGDSKQILENGNDLLTAQQATILKSVMDILFPDDGNGPSVDDLHSFEYVMWVLHDSGASEKYRTLAVEGIDWAEERIQQTQQRGYLDLNQAERERAVAYFNEDAYGQEWLNVIMSYILESVLLDPVYGGNPDGIGWKWLNHTPGYPQATEELRYENVLKTVRSDYPTELL